MPDLFSLDSIVFYANIGIFTGLVNYLMFLEPRQKHLSKIWEGRWIQHE